MSIVIAERAFNLGQSAGKAARQRDRGRVSHFQRIYKQWQAGLTADERAVANKAYTAGYEDESFDSTQYEARSL